MRIQFQLLTVLIIDLTKSFGIDHICYLNETPRLAGLTNYSFSLQSIII